VKKQNGMPIINTLSRTHKENRVVRKQEERNLAPRVLSALCNGSLIVELY
jgi:ribosomal protein L35AE/L33A